ncbi:MAG: dynamin family protein [Chitinophagaceae bacterium]
MDITNETLKRNLLSVSKRNELHELHERIENIQPQSVQIKVAFLGEFSAGKTTLVNALVRKKLLPMYDTPTTSVITEISAGDKDEAFTTTGTNDENGTPLKKQIQLWELGSETTSVEPGKMILLKLANLDFLPERTVLIDTPGIASIEEMHSDITVGYLPVVDVAFLVIHPVAGDVPKTLLAFLKQFPVDLFEKIHFIISRSDEISDTSKELIKEKIIGSLSKLLPHPKIMFVSGKMALDAIHAKETFNETMYDASGIKQILDIIKNDIPLHQDSVERKRIREMLLKAKTDLLELLQFKLKSLNWDMGQFNAKIGEYRNEINTIEKEIAQFKEKFQQIKQKTIGTIGSIVDEYAGVISHKISKNESFDTLIDPMITEIQQRIELGMSELKSIKFQIPDQGTVNIAEILKALIEKETSSIRDIADLITDASTFAMTVWIVPGSSPALNAGEALAGTSVVVAQGANSGNQNEKSGFLKTLGKIAGAAGSFIKKVNPLEKIKTVVLPYFINPKLAVVMKGKIIATINQIYTILGISLNEELEETYLIRIKDKKALLIETEQLKKRHAENVDAEKIQLQKDIETIITAK